jgi:hypothetical protein
MSEKDGVRIAGAVQLEALAEQAARLAGRLRSTETLPPHVVAQLLVDADRMLSRLARHQDRLPRAKDDAA